MDIVDNPGIHKHRVVSTPTGDVCQDCGEVQIKPILSWDDERLHAPEETPAAKEYTLEELLPCPLDFLLLQMAFRAEVKPPNYIDIISEAYDGAEGPPMPPHTRHGDTARWWNE